MEENLCRNSRGRGGRVGGWNKGRGKRDFVKKSLVIIILEDNIDKQNEMFNLLEKKIEKYLIPIKKDRHYQRKKNKKNKYSINKRKSF